MNIVIDDLMRYIERAIDRNGLAKVILAPLTAAALLVGLGIIAGGPLWAQVTRLVVAAIIFIMLISLAARNRSYRSQLKASQLAAVKYADRIIELNGLTYEIESWSEEQFVSKDRLKKTIRLVARSSGTNSLLLCWHISKGPYSVGRLSDRERSNVRAYVNEVDSNGTVGANLTITPSWNESDLKLYVELPEPLAPGKSLCLLFSFDWPSWQTPLSAGETDVVEYKFHRTIENFQLKIVLDKNIGLKDEPRISTTGSLPRPKVEYTDGRSEINVPSWTAPTREFTLRITPKQK